MKKELSSNPKNVYFINVAKTLSMFLIVLGHLPIPHDLYAFINCFRMPLFFIITGYLFKLGNTSFNDFLLKKAKTLLLPYYVFALISLAFWYFFGQHYGDDLGANHSLAHYLTGAILAIPSKLYMGFNFPIWFLPSLFCSEIIFYWSKKIFRQYAWLFFIFCFALGTAFMMCDSPRLPYGLDVSLFALLFIQIGYYLREKAWIEKYICKPSLGIKLTMAGLFLLLTIFISQLNQSNGNISMVNRVFNNYPLYFAGAFSGTLFILYLSNCIPKWNLFNFFGRNTIVILGFHLMTFSIIKGIQVFVLNIPLEVTEGHLTTYILYASLVFILLIPVIYLINKYTPFLIGRKKGILC